jgi:ubiquinone/menaquinone biosynthesis C-methylase UbiE
MERWRSYDDVAEIYERIHAPRMAEPARDLVAALALRPGELVLDVGTGTGLAAEAAGRSVGSSGLVVGVDVSVGMLGVARAARPSLRLLAAEAIDLPFRDGTFDALTASFVLHHFTRYETALFDMLRVLRPGGRMAATAWGVAEDELERIWREQVEALVGVRMLQDVRRQTAPWWDRFADPVALKGTLYDAGLRRIEIVEREYRFRYTIDEYVAGIATRASGRFIRDMLGEDAFRRFLDRARAAYAERFVDPLTDLRDVLVAVGVKE